LILPCGSYNSIEVMERLILKNGVVVEVEDKTCVLSHDLYMIHLEFTTIVKLESEDSELMRYCGSEYLRKTRVFRRAAVHEQDLQELINSMKESYLQTTKSYMEHPKFINRFKQMCIEEFREQEEKMRWAATYEE
jgi:hypothetical protein